MWVKLTSGDYANLDAALSLQTANVGNPEWRIRVNGTSTLTLEAGPYTTQALAQEAMQALVVGIDPGTVI